MSECKTFVFPDAAMCGSGNKGLEGAFLGSMMSGGMGINGGMWNNPIWAIVFLAALRNGGIFGNDTNGNNQLDAIQAQLASNQNSTLLMDAIKGNAASVHKLATSLNCDISAVQPSICAVQPSICQVGNQVGKSSAQRSIQGKHIQMPPYANNPERDFDPYEEPDMRYGRNNDYRMNYRPDHDRHPDRDPGIGYRHY